MTKIWLAMKDPGGQKAVLPVGNELSKRGHQIINIAHGKAVELLTKKKQPFINSPSIKLLFDPFDAPDVYITSMCSEGGIGRNIIPLLRERGIPTVAVSDYWGGALDVEFADSKYWPDAICVQDALSKEMVLDSWPEYAEEKIHVTGQPAFDTLATFNATEIEARVRQDILYGGKLPIIVYAGQLKGSTAVLGALVEALNSLPGYVHLIAIRHPRFFDDSLPEEQGLWNVVLRQSYHGLTLDHEVPTEVPTIEEWIAASTVVISMTSTALAIAAHLRKECISILPPKIEQTQIGPRGFPIEQLGACAVARTQNELEWIIEQSLSSSGLGLQANQERNFITDGKAAERVADVALKLTSR